VILLLILNFLSNQPRDEIIIKDAWLRPNGKGMTTALYFNIENTGEHADTLFKVDFEFAARVEIHETYEKDGMMGMRKVENIIIEAGNSFSLKPGAHHIMLIKLKKDINDGKQEEFTLHFKKAGKIKITAKVKKQ
jgi:hypothetical protein